MKLALGTVQFGIPYGVSNQTGQISSQEGKAILQLASDNDINTLDTAISYGESEQCLGEIGVKAWDIISKLSAVPEDCVDILHWISTEVNGSLKRLNVNNLHGLLLHRPQQLLDKNGEQIYQVMQQLKQQGLIKKIGISIYDPSELDALCGRFQFDIVQAPFNVIDHRLIETGWMTRLSEQGTELHIRSIFLQGLLMMSERDRPSKFNRWSSLWVKWHDWLKDMNLTPLQACVRYTLSFSEISEVIVGVDNHIQLKEIIDAADGSVLKGAEIFNTDEPDLINPSRWTNFT